jgi:Domain of unknown function (DUF4345)
METIALIAAFASLALGLLGFIAPHRAMNLVGLNMDPALAHSVSEVRATYGGIFMGMSLYALVSQEPHAFLALAAAWLMAGFARILSAAIDRAPTPANFAGIVVELAIGGLVAWPFLHHIA